VLMASLTPAIQALYDTEGRYDFVQAPDPEVLSWTQAHPTNGTVSLLGFFEEERLAGWTLSRVYGTNEGRRAALLDVYAPRPSPAVYSWMISETAAFLARSKPDLVRARATCPLLAEALRANRFRRVGPEVPIHTWPPPLRAKAPHITLNHADEPLRPYLPDWAGLPATE